MSPPVPAHGPCAGSLGCAHSLLCVLVHGSPANSPLPATTKTHGGPPAALPARPPPSSSPGGCPHTALDFHHIEQLGVSQPGLWMMLVNPDPCATVRGFLATTADMGSSVTSVERGIFCYELEIRDMLEKVAFLGHPRNLPVALGIVLMKVQTAPKGGQGNQAVRGMPPVPVGGLPAIWDSELLRTMI